MLRLRSLVAIVSLAFVALVALAPVASAGTDGQYPLPLTPPTVLGADFEQGDPPAAAAAATAEVQGQTLPVTGGDIVGLAVLGIVALGAGFALVSYQRKTTARV